VPAKKFDATYGALDVKDHTQDVEETGEEARRGEKPKVVKEAKKDLPVLEVHLAVANERCALLRVKTL
jgi:hypothetical protein